MELQDFLERNHINDEVWQAASVGWDALLEIYTDYESRVRQLEDTAEFFVKRIQAFSAVHSVRWRVKDPEHLLEKIVRKRASAASDSRYMDINSKNYHEIVTDLIGVRALHLFKEDCLVVHDQIKDMWSFHEAPVSYIRDGDRTALVELLVSRDIESKIHPAGYRSVHYVLRTKPDSREVLVEVQVRTIFEEGWSEIDHKVRYPNFSNNSQVEDVLKIFNRLAGSADEMGGFIKSLSLELEQLDSDVGSAVQERDAALLQMQKLLSELSKANKTKAEMLVEAELMQKELHRLNRAIKEKTAKDSEVRTSSVIRRIRSTNPLHRGLAPD